MKEKLPLSVAIITYNEEDIIGRTLEAVKDIASEIVVVDSGSTDRTREIAESYGAKVYVEEWKGHVAQKNSALRKCTQEWILCLDADEVVSEGLKESIRNAINKPFAEGYYINRKTYYLGKLLEYAWQPEWRLRLVKRSASPIWKGINPHDYLDIEGRKKKLKGDLYHFSFKGLEDHIRKSLKYAKISSISMYKDGKRTGFFDIVARPIWAFIKIYLIKKGFLDGYRGFIVSVIGSFYTFMKYAFLLELDLKNTYESNIWLRK